MRIAPTVDQKGFDDVPRYDRGISNTIVFLFQMRCGRMVQEL